jgi:arylsulfatase
MIVSWPKGMKAKHGSVTSQPGHLIDFMATCVDVAGATYPKKYGERTITPVQGKSLLPIFKGETREPHEWLYFQFSNNRAVRKGDMKLVSARGGGWELYDLSNDRSELNNLAAGNPEQVAEMSKLWTHIATEIEGAPSRVTNPAESKKKDGKKKKKKK